MIPRFGRPVSQLSMITSEMNSFIYDMYHEKLNSSQQEWLVPAELEKFAQAIHCVGASLTNWWVIVSGTFNSV